MSAQIQTEQWNSDPHAAVNQKLQTAEVDLVVPASLYFLPVLCATLREFCAVLPVLVEATENSLATNPLPSEVRSRFGTAHLRLPGNSGTTIMVSYSHLVYSVELALQEAASNIVRHGYGGDNLDERIRLHLSVQPFLSANQEINQQARLALIIELFDRGAPFDTALATYDLPDPTQLLESGYGLYLIHKLTDQLQYFQRSGSNCLQMIKFL